MTLPTSLRAQQAPTQQELWRASAAGNYLAAREATAQRDTAAAAAYYRAALRGDPKNSDLLDRTFLAVLSDGEIDEAVKLADRLVQLDRGHRIARACVRGLAVQT